MDDILEPRVACPRSVGDDRAVRLNGWLLTEGRTHVRAAELVASFAHQLTVAGLPLQRFTVHLPQNHPQFAGHTVVWTADDGVVIDRTVSRLDLTSIMYANSPMALMHRTGRAVRRRLEGADADIDFQVVEELVADGITDYMLSPLTGSAGSRAPGFSIATRRPGGFSDAEIALVETISPALGAVVDIMLHRSMMQSLLDAYVGREAARHILDGEVVVGGGRTIDAVILFADLRGFTALAETLSRDRVLAMLNDFFSSIVGVVLEHGGEVLKFLGDGLLAVFPLRGPAEADRRPGDDRDQADLQRAAMQADGTRAESDEDEEDETVAHAIMAALEAQQAIQARNAERDGGELPTLQAGVALHVGSVLFGNIGTEERLDFTVIGPAVNLAARLQQLCAEIGRPILVSDRFARRCPVQLSHEGRYRLRGLAQPQDVYSPVVVAMT